MKSDRECFTMKEHPNEAERVMEHIHPFFTHFPVALYVFECFLLALFVFKKEDQYKKFANLTFRAAYGMSIFAMISGLRDAGWLKNMKGDVLEHALFAAGLFVLNTIRGIYWCKGKESAPSNATILLIGAILSVVLTILTGFEGGELVYGV